MATQEQIESMRMLEKKMYETESSIKQYYERYLKQSRFTLKIGGRRAFNIFLEIFFYGWSLFGMVMTFLMFWLVAVIAHAHDTTVDEGSREKVLEFARSFIGCLADSSSSLPSLYSLIFFSFCSTTGCLFTAILLTRYRRRRTATRRLAMMTDSIATETRFHFQELNSLRVRLGQSLSSSPPPNSQQPPPVPPKP